MLFGLACSICCETNASRRHLSSGLPGVLGQMRHFQNTDTADEVLLEISTLGMSKSAELLCCAGRDQNPSDAVHSAPKEWRPPQLSAAPSGSERFLSSPGAHRGQKLNVSDQSYVKGFDKY